MTVACIQHHYQHDYHHRVDSHRSDATRARAFIECAGFKIFVTLPSLVKLLPVVVVVVVAGERSYAKRSSRREDHNSTASVCV